MQIIKGIALTFSLLISMNAHALMFNFNDADDGSANFSITSEGITYTFSNPSADSTFSINNNELLFGDRPGSASVDMTSFELTVDMNAILNTYQVGNNGTANGGVFSIADTNSTLISGLDGHPAFNTPIDIVPDLMLLVGETYTFTYTPNNGTSITGLSGFDVTPSAVPVPAAVWLFGSALLGLSRFKKKT